MRLIVVIVGGISIFVQGCSIHPLPEDVTRTATFDIVKKIRCEARDAIFEYAALDKSTLGDALYSILKNEDKEISATKKALKKVDDEYKNIVEKITGTDFGDQTEKLENLVERIFTEGDLISKTGVSKKIRKAYGDKIKSIKEADITNIEKFYRYKGFLTLVVAEINQRINLRNRARLETLLKYELRNSAIGYGFKLTMSETNNAGGASKFLFPFSNGNVSLDINFGEGKERKNERSFELIEYFTEVLADQSLLDCAEPEKNWKYPIVGSIGIGEVVDTYARLTGLNKFDTAGGGRSSQDGSAPQRSGSNDDGQGQRRDVNQFADVLTFTTTYNGTLTPKIELAPVSHDFRLTNASGVFGGGRSDIHRVTIALRTSTKTLLSRDESVPSPAARFKARDLGIQEENGGYGIFEQDPKSQLRNFFGRQRSFEQLRENIFEE